MHELSAWASPKKDFLPFPLQQFASAPLLQLYVRLSIYHHNAFYEPHTHTHNYIQKCVPHIVN